MLPLMDVEKRIGKSYWFDLTAADARDAMSFYEALFGWIFLRMNDSPLSDYWVIQAGDELIGGLRQTPGGKPAADGPVLYFTVDDLGCAAARARELGGKLVGEPVDLGKGRGSYQWFRDREQKLAALWAPAKESK